MLLRWILVIQMMLIATTVNAEEYDTSPSYVCSVSYEPFLGKLADGGTAGKSGYILVRFEKQPNCNWSSFDRFATFCSKGATSSLCAKAALYDPFAMQMLYGALIQALDKKTQVYNYYGECISGSKLCIHSTNFYAKPQ